MSKKPIAAPKFEELPATATPAELQEALANVPNRIVKRVAKLLGNKEAKLFRKARNIDFILLQSPSRAVLCYNISVALANKRWDKATEIIKVLAELIQKLRGVKSTEQIFEILLATETDEEPAEEA